MHVRLDETIYYKAILVSKYAETLLIEEKNDDSCNSTRPNKGQQ